MRRLLSLALVALAALSFAAAPAAEAVTVPLADLLGPNCDPCSITVGDKTFSDFTLTVSGTGTVTPINVITQQVGDLIGLRFQGGLFAANGQSLDVLIGYKVTVNDPSFLLSDVHLGFNGDVIGSANTNVIETVTKTDATIIGQAFVNNPPPVLDENIDLDEAVREAFVVKDIFLTAAPGENLATISFIDQLFSQTKVPEPASLLLLGSGLVGLAGAAWFRKGE